MPAETVDTNTFTPAIRSVFTPGDKKKGKKGKKPNKSYRRSHIRPTGHRGVSQRG